MAAIPTATKHHERECQTIARGKTKKVELPIRKILVIYSYLCVYINDNDV